MAERPLGWQRGEAAAPVPCLPPCTGRSISACRSCPRTPWAQSSGCSRERQGLCSGEEREGHSEHLRQRTQPTEQFKVRQVTKKGCLSPPHLSDKVSQPTVLPFVQNSVGVTPEATHHFCRTTTHPRFGLLEPCSYKWQHFYHHHKQPG